MSIRFVNAKARACYEYSKINRGSIKERRFAFTDKFSRIPRKIVIRGWDTFFSQPRAAVIPVVREF